MRKSSQQKKKPEWLTINLNVNEPRRDNRIVAVNLSMWANFLVKKYRLWIDNFTILYPQIVDNNLMIANKSTISKLNNFVTRTHCGHCQMSYWTKWNEYSLRTMHQSFDSSQRQVSLNKRRCHFFCVSVFLIIYNDNRIYLLSSNWNIVWICFFFCQEIKHKT